jgi:hypothetical protein
MAAATQGTPSKGAESADSKPAGGEFDKDAAASALDRAIGGASSCIEEGARVPGSVTVTFGPSGKVTQATLNRDMSDSQMEKCVVAAFRRASVPAFSGAPVSVTKTFRLKR